jgi:iron(III) transport system substrate-binding protein
MVLAILLVVPSTGMAAGKPKTVAEIALYQGPDREKMLIEGAKKEGEIVTYDVASGTLRAVQAFAKKYPFIKISRWRSSTPNILKRVMEEYASGRFHVDVVEMTSPSIFIAHREGVFLEFYSPELQYYGDEAKVKGKTGVSLFTDHENYIVLGFNTKLVSPAEAPKTYKDLLDPKWKGRMSIPGSSTGVRWIGNALDVMGRDFIEKLSRQDLKVQNVSGSAMVTMIVAGEVHLSPAIYTSSTFKAKGKGAPIEWRPLEPVLVGPALSGLSRKAPHPHAALLFIDYLHSKEGQKLLMEYGYSSARKDIGSVEQKFKKTYLHHRYSVEEFEEKFDEWQSLMKRLFIKKR